MMLQLPRAAAGFLSALTVSLVILLCQQRPPWWIENGKSVVPAAVSNRDGWQLRHYYDGSSSAAVSEKAPNPVPAPKSTAPSPPPALTDLVVDPSTLQSNANVQHLLDFAIVGFPKTATSALLEWLALHPQIAAHTHELHQLQHGLIGDFVTELYRLPTTTATSSASSLSTVKRGYKAPRDITSPTALELLAHHWPEARLVVGLRHPVQWFESFYNFRVRKGRIMADPTSPVFMESSCPPALTHGVCVHESHFHNFLAQLGKTPLATPDEMELLGLPSSHPLHTTWKRQPNPIFLYELSQLHGPSADPDRFRRDLSEYLQLDPPLEPLPMATAHSLYLPNRTKTLDLCHPSLRSLRAELMDGARNASRWIRQYLLSSPDVVVSSPDQFHSALLSWEVDPCDSAAAAAAASGH